MCHVPIIWAALMLFAPIASAEPASALFSNLFAQQPLSFVADPVPEIWWKDVQTVKALQLSDDQISRIEEKYQRNRKELDLLNEEIAREKEKFESDASHWEYDPQKVPEVSVPIIKLGTKLFGAKMRMQFSYQQELSEEQRQILQKMQKSAMGNKPRPIGSIVMMRRNFTRTASGEPVYTPSEVQVLPQEVSRPMPKYTYEARSKRIKGIISLALIVNKEGRVQEVKVLKGLGYGLDESAVDAITRQWLFTPGMIDGNPVNVELMVQVEFKLF